MADSNTSNYADYEELNENKDPDDGSKDGNTANSDDDYEEVN